MPRNPDLLYLGVRTTASGVPILVCAETGREVAFQVSLDVHASVDEAASVNARFYLSDRDGAMIPGWSERDGERDEVQDAPPPSNLDLAVEAREKRRARAQTNGADA